MTAEFDGAVALVTGAGSGIGRATAIEFARHGATVAIVDRDPVAAEAVAAALRASGRRAGAFVADVASERDVERAIADVIATYGQLDFAHNNAGIAGEQAPLVRTDLSTWSEVFAVDVTGVFLCLRAELRQMAAQGHGAVVNTASIAALTGPAGLGAYAAAKHAVVGLTRVAAIEHATDGIRVNAVAPGFVHTAMTDPSGQADEDWVRGALGAIPMGRGAQPDEIAQAVLWLCSDAASFVTGQVLSIDGGQSAGRPRRARTTDS